MARSVSRSTRTSLHTRNKAINGSTRIRKIKKQNARVRAHASSAVSPTRFRNRHPFLKALLPVALVLVAVSALVITKVAGSSRGTPTASKVMVESGTGTSKVGTTALPNGVLSDVTSVSAKTLVAVGTPSSSLALVPTGIKTPLTARDGKPEVLFVSAEYCPFCAAQRWPLVEALSRFGSFSGLSATHSSTTDVYPDTKSFSFYGSSYASSSLNFTSVELQTNRVSGNSYGTLQTLTAPENALLSKFDNAPYTNEVGSIPFLDVANRYLIVGSGYSPQLLQGLTMKQIAAQLNDRSSPVAAAIDGEANQIVAAITKATGIQPSVAVESRTTHP
jgi:Domain of unknown function (DUF929)